MGPTAGKQASFFIAAVCKRVSTDAIFYHATVRVLSIGFHLTPTYALLSQNTRNIVFKSPGSAASTCSAPESLKVGIGSCSVESDASKGERRFGHHFRRRFGHHFRKTLQRA